MNEDKKALITTVKYVTGGQNLTIGQTYRYNHGDCTAGVDVRKRLYVTVKRDGLLCYCHNCGIGAFVKGDNTRANVVEGRDDAKRDYIPTPDELKVMTGTSPPVWAERRIAGLQSRGIYNAEIPLILQDAEYCYLIAYDYALLRTTEDAIDVVYFRDYLGFQKRNMAYPKVALPKYVTYRANRSLTMASMLIPVEQKSVDGVIVVEDLLSGINMVLAGYAAYVLYGCSMNIVDFNAKYRRISGDPPIYVWLDNDNAGIIRMSEQMSVRLGLIAPTYNVLVEKDPKDVADPSELIGKYNAR